MDWPKVIDRKEIDKNSAPGENNNISTSPLNTSHVPDRFQRGDGFDVPSRVKNDISPRLCNITCTTSLTLVLTKRFQTNLMGFPPRNIPDLRLLIRFSALLVHFMIRFSVFTRDKFPRRLVELCLRLYGSFMKTSPWKHRFGCSALSNFNRLVCIVQSLSPCFFGLKKTAEVYPQRSNLTPKLFLIPRDAN